MVMSRNLAPLHDVNSRVKKLSIQKREAMNPEKGSYNPEKGMCQNPNFNLTTDVQLIPPAWRTPDVAAQVVMLLLFFLPHPSHHHSIAEYCSNSCIWYHQKWLNEWNGGGDHWRRHSLWKSEKAKVKRLLSKIVSSRQASCHIITYL